MTERFMPHMEGEIRHEHMHRYAVAQEFVKGKAVLDIACGEGYGAAYMANTAASVAGVDIDPSIIEHARRQYGVQPNLEFHVGSCEEIPLTDGSVDVVTSFETIEHHDKHLEMMQEIKRVLRPGGILVISSPNRPVYSEQSGFVNPFHVKELDYEEFTRLLKQHFHHVLVYGQKITAGSFVFPLDDQGTESFAAYSSNGSVLSTEPITLESPRYFIAVCSDIETKPQPPLDSIYVDQHNELMQATQAEASRLRDEAGELRAERQRVEQSNRELLLQLDDIRTSFGFKLLRRVYWPLSALLVPRLFRPRLSRVFQRLKHPLSKPKSQVRELEPESADGLQWSLETALPQALIIGKGNFLYLKGWCYHPRREINGLSVLVDGAPRRIVNHSMGEPEILREQAPLNDPAGNSLTSGFWAALSFEEIEKQQDVNLGLRAVFNDGQMVEIQLGTLTLLPGLEKEQPAHLVPAEPQPSDEPLIAICLATYNPPLDLLSQQIDSLIAQTHQHWVCIINDDCSDEIIFHEIQKIATRDPRFQVHRNATRLGFYRNFERSLTLAPGGAEFIAFCDQDDLWYPHKLAATLAEFKPGINLVYSDMDIVTREGEIISHTYWNIRRNNFTRLGTLLLANTVTGAATVFRRDLLALLLPFPEAIADLYHDHWVACVALAKGKIGYVNKPLYAYTQHSGNVHGHLKSTPVKWRGEIRGLVSLLTLFLKGTTDPGPYLKNVQRSYESWFVRVTLLARILLLRVQDAPEKHKAVLRRFSGFEDSLWPLFREAVADKLARRPTLGIELICLRAAVSMRLFTRYFRRNRQFFYQQQSAPAGRLDASPDIDFIPQKIAPLKLRISKSAQRRVNIVVSEINFKRVFAGYLCVFNLALALKRSGYQVRLVLVDPCDYEPAKWRLALAGYEGLEDLLDLVETAYLYDRSNALEVNPSDAFLATSWWTAHVAHQASQSLSHDRFVYLIQDYEPLFYPAGSFYALAEQSYTFPHRAIFSTQVLRDYFQEQHIGVFSTANSDAADIDPVVILNAVSRYQLSEGVPRLSERKKLLFYARPEQQYAARNIFQLGVLALRQTISEGHFDLKRWQFDGIGAFGKYRNVPLGHQIELTMLPNLSLREFVKILPTYDLGLSLMLTPHTSIMPLDMAAAGLVTVTNTFATKTSKTMSDISPNIIAVPPTLDGLKAGLIAALAEVDNVEQRVAGARLNWSSSWDETFDAQVMKRLRDYLG